MTSLDALLAEAARGGGPDTIMLMRILGEAATEAEARAGLSRAAAACGADGRARLRRLQDLWAAHPQAWPIVRSTLAGIAHDRQDSSPEGVLRYWAEAFDRLAVASPEASVALYSLGSAELLARSTNEILAFMHRIGILSPGIDILDMGCGIGRFVQALAPRARSVTGLDISSRMIEEARRRCDRLPNVRLEETGGHDLAGIADASVDLVLAADVFPYLVQAGGRLARTHVEEFARVLRGGGAALILNYSYRSDQEADRHDLAQAGEATGLVIERAGRAEFTTWDGSTFLLRKPAAG